MRNPVDRQMSWKNEAAARHWDRAVRHKSRNWWDSTILNGYMNRQICGAQVEAGAAIATALRNAFPDTAFARAASVGCGTAAKELALIRSGAVEAFDLFEISRERIASGTATIASLGLQSQAAYVDRDPIATGPRDPLYDLVYWDHSLHHMQDVRAALLWSRDVLRPGGVVCVNDYVGPTRLQWTSAEAALANGFLSRAARTYGLEFRKVRAGGPISRLRTYMRDPSEAPQSDKIESAFGELFGGAALRPLGGTLLNICGGIVMGLPDPPEALQADLAAADLACLQAGSHHFAFGMWRKG